MVNPVLNRGVKGGHGRAAERKAGKRIGARVRPGSGAVEGCKGDLVLPEFLMESKSTVHESLSVKLSWLRKIAQEALNTLRYPALLVQFVDERGEVPIGQTGYKSWVMIPEKVFKELVDEVSDYRKGK